MFSFDMNGIGNHATEHAKLWHVLDLPPEALVLCPDEARVVRRGGDDDSSISCLDDIGNATADGEVTNASCAKPSSLCDVAIRDFVDVRRDLKHGR